MTQTKIRCRNSVCVRRCCYYCYRSRLVSKEREKATDTKLHSIEARENPHLRHTTDNLLSPTDRQHTSNNREITTQQQPLHPTTTTSHLLVPPMGQRPLQSVVPVVVRRPRLPWMLLLQQLLVVVVVVVCSWTATSNGVLLVTVEASPTTATLHSVITSSAPTSVRRKVRPNKSWYRVQLPPSSTATDKPPVVKTTTTAVPLVSTTSSSSSLLSVADDDDESKLWTTARRALWRRRQIIFTCLLTASAGFANVQASHLYGSLWLTVCSGHLVRLGAALARALVVHVQGTNENRRASSNIISWTIPVAVLVGYTCGTALVRWSYNNSMVALQQQQPHTPAQAAAAAVESCSSSSSLPLPLHGPAIRSCRAAEPMTTTALSPSMVVALRVVRSMGPWIGACFVGADAMAVLLRSWTHFSPLVLPVVLLLQAMAYGMIHLAASDASGGMVLFAVTGHLAGATKATVDHHCQPHTKDSASSSHTVVGAATTRTTTPTPTGWYHAFMVVSFLVGSIVGSLVWDHAIPACLAKGITTPRWMPLHSWTGLFYTALFWWYAQPLDGIR
jgi:hypothetical protein